jgi:hypothetical protein
MTYFQYNMRAPAIIQTMPVILRQENCSLKKIADNKSVTTGYSEITIAEAPVVCDPRKLV